MHRSSTDGTIVACLHGLDSGRSIRTFDFEKEVGRGRIGVFGRWDDLMIQVLPDSSINLLGSLSPVEVGLRLFEDVWGHVVYIPEQYIAG